MKSKYPQNAGLNKSADSLEDKKIECHYTADNPDTKLLKLS